MFDLDDKYLAPAGIVLGWLLSQLSGYVKFRAEKKKNLTEVLAFLLLLRQEMTVYISTRLRKDYLPIVVKDSVINSRLTVHSYILRHYKNIDLDKICAQACYCNAFVAKSIRQIFHAYEDTSKISISTQELIGRGEQAINFHMNYLKLHVHFLEKVIARISVSCGLCTFFRILFLIKLNFLIPIKYFGKDDFEKSLFEIIDSFELIESMRSKNTEKNN